MHLAKDKAMLLIGSDRPNIESPRRRVPTMPNGVGEKQAKRKFTAASAL
jgi:hypothetical protein